MMVSAFSCAVSSVMVTGISAVVEPLVTLTVALLLVTPLMV